MYCRSQVKVLIFTLSAAISALSLASVPTRDVALPRNATLEGRPVWPASDGNVTYRGVLPIKRVQCTGWDVGPNLKEAVDKIVDWSDEGRRRIYHRNLKYQMQGDAAVWVCNCERDLDVTFWRDEIEEVIALIFHQCGQDMSGYVHIFDDKRQFHSNVSLPTLSSLFFSFSFFSLSAA
jgi:hypothetical protein